MKKITLLNIFVFLFSITSYAQNFSTGTVEINASVNFSIKFDINASTNTVTYTLTGDSNRWYGVAPGVMQGSSMGDLGDDVVTYGNLGLQDRNFTGGFNQPNIDSSQDWTVISDNVSTGIRTVVATRALNTADTNDFIFPDSETSFPILWAFGNSTNVAGGHSSRGGTMLGLTLGNESFALTIPNFSISPNPASSFINISFEHKDVNAYTLEVYDVLGKKIHTQELIKQTTEIQVNEWSRGIYLVKVNSNGFTQTKRFVKK